MAHRPSQVLLRLPSLNLERLLRNKNNMQPSNVYSLTVSRKFWSHDVLRHIRVAALFAKVVFTICPVQLYRKLYKFSAQFNFFPLLKLFLWLMIKILSNFHLLFWDKFLKLVSDSVGFCSEKPSSEWLLWIMFARNKLSVCPAFVNLLNKASKVKYSQER